jgi:lipid-A-disaccharide synthase
MSLTIALVAGEDSGDQLGAALINRLKSHFPDSRFVGMGGERMRAAGLDSWWDCSELAVFGLFEVLKHFRKIWRIRQSVKERLLEIKPDVFIGIDAPDFNLGLERKLKNAGIRTVHYVSPTVWAWRAWRTDKIKRSADLVLCLFPFEPKFLADHGIKAAFVGHPMADQIDAVNETSAARQALGIIGGSPVFALLPGSRQGEVERLSEPMLGAARLLKAEFPEAKFVAALANPDAAEVFDARLRSRDGLKVLAVDGRVRDVIAASDVVICASGTVTLETLLINRPMVVTYRLAAPTYYLARATGLVKARQISLPNILASRVLVPELIQENATPERIASEASAWLHDQQSLSDLSAEFMAIHETLRCDASQRAADEIATLLETRT